MSELENDFSNYLKSKSKRKSHYCFITRMILNLVGIIILIVAFVIFGLKLVSIMTLSEVPMLQ